MVLFGYLLSGAIAAAIIALGARFMWAPAAASGAFGIPDSPSPSTAFTGWLAVKGTRDIVCGLFVILLMTIDSPRLLGEFLLVASLIAFGDMVTVLRAGGRRTVAFGIHGATALVIVAAGLMLVAAAR